MSPHTLDTIGWIVFGYTGVFIVVVGYMVIRWLIEEYRNDQAEAELASSWPAGDAQKPVTGSVVRFPAVGGTGLKPVTSEEPTDDQEPPLITDIGARPGLEALSGFPPRINDNHRLSRPFGQELASEEPAPWGRLPRHPLRVIATDPPEGGE